MSSKVSIIGHTPNPGAICAAAARISTTVGSADQVYGTSLELSPEKNENLIGKVLQSGHQSVVEHICFNLSFDNVSAYVEQFLIEFRLASFTVKSRRYVDFSGQGYYIPDFSAADGTLAEEYAEHMNYLYGEYDFLISSGIPKEDARFVLPYAFRSNFYCTVNARELYHILDAMLFGRGRFYPELVALGESLLEQCTALCPSVFHSLTGSRKKAPDRDEALLSLLKQRDLQSAPPAKSPPLVELLYGTEHPEEVIATAALHSLPEYGACCDCSDPKLQSEVLRVVLSDTRCRELEHAVFTFRINGASLSAITHLVRHRMQSHLVPAFLNAYDFDRFVLPDSIREQGLEQRYTEIFHRSKERMNRFISLGMNRTDTVYLLLSGLLLPVVTTMNARELMVFLGLRTCNRSQWEIRRISEEMLALLRQKHPLLFGHYGPKCYMQGRCNEGRMSCGRLDEVLQRYAPISNL